MRRPAAVLLVGLLAGFSSRAPLLHIHDFAEAGRSEHHHGPASHEHHEELLDSHDDEVAYDEADPAETAVAVSFVGPVPASVQLVGELAVEAILVEPPAVVRMPLELTDVRAHGPPGTASISPRAPPSVPA